MLIILFVPEIHRQTRPPKSLLECCGDLPTPLDSLLECCGDLPTPPYGHPSVEGILTYDLKISAKSRQKDSW